MQITSLEFREKIAQDWLENKPTLRYLSKKYHASADCIRRILIPYGLQVKSIKKKYQLDENCFEKVETQEQAYWLGFLYADGTNTGVSISLRLQERDREVTEEFRKFLKTDSPRTPTLPKNP